MRDLLEELSEIYEKERAKVKAQRWGSGLLSRQDADGNWGGGVYTPKLRVLKRWEERNASIG
jgi:hypothetical protein